MTENPYRAALALLGPQGQNWAQGTFRRTHTTWYGRKVDQYCIVGAFQEVDGEGWDVLIKGIAALGPKLLMHWNDDPNRKWEEVRALLLQAAEVWDAEHSVVEMPPPPPEPEPVVPMPPVPQGVLIGAREG